MNEKEIGTNARSVISDFQAGQYVKSGQDLGTIIRLLLSINFD
jgi:hypothetical protein